MVHIPVLTKQVLQYLDPKPNENFIDCTIGQGGHAKLILEKIGPEGKILGIDLDSRQIENTKLQLADFKERIILANDSYSNLKDIIEEKKFEPASGILLDIGMSSEQLEKSSRGFTFLKDEPLDMRYDNKNQNFPPKADQSRTGTAEEIINKWPEKEIERIFEEYGEEKFAKKIAKEIIEKRKRPKGYPEIKSTFQLVQIIKEAVPLKFQYGRIHCATKVFQALRIAVNSELENLKKVLPQAVSILSPGGRLVIISFHSLEDRIVKNFFQDESKEKIINILTKKPVTASSEEIKLNPRSRSAKLRAIIKN